MDITSTTTLLAAFEQVAPVTTFLRDRYFPTNPATDIFNSESVIAEYKDGSKKLAPFVSPRKNGIALLRDGYEMKMLKPANVAPKRPLTIDDLNKKGFGEALFSNLSPEQRALAIMLKDIKELEEATSRREEAMAAEVMTTNALVMKHYADKSDKYEEMTIQYYTESANPAAYTTSATWDGSSADILGDLGAMVKMLTQKGLPATDVILGASVADVIMQNETILNLLDNRRVNIGGIDPKMLENGAALLGRIVVKGHPLDLYTYDATYEAENGTDTPYVPFDSVVVTAPGAGRTAYGAVTILEDDKQFHTYANRRVPHVCIDQTSNTRDAILTSHPLTMPNHKNAFIVSTVL